MRKRKASSYKDFTAQDHKDASAQHWESHKEIHPNKGVLDSHRHQSIHSKRSDEHHEEFKNKKIKEFHDEVKTHLERRNSNDDKFNKNKTYHDKKSHEAGLKHAESELKNNPENSQWYKDKVEYHKESLKNL